MSSLTAPTGLTMSQSTFQRRDVMRAWCESIPAGTHVDLRGLEAKCDRFTEDAEVVLVTEGAAPIMFNADGSASRAQISAP